MKPNKYITTEEMLDKSENNFIDCLMNSLEHL